MFKECLILFGIILLHELGHVIVIKVFGYKINYIEILPFGGMTKIEKDINSSINEEIIISLCGIFMQLALFIIMSFLCSHHFINSKDYYIFKKYNISILLFNLLPIIPLDGSIFIRSILEKICSFYHAHILSIIISFIFLVIFIYINYVYSLNNYIIVIFLIYRMIEYIKNYKYMENKFYLERYLNKYNYKKIKIIKRMKQMQKEKNHVFRYKNKIYNEHEILGKYFCNK